jgi:hypothetical protein
MKTLLLSLAFCVGVSAQPGTVYQAAFTNLVRTGPGPFYLPAVSAPLGQIGQVSHQIYGYLHNNGALVCDTTANSSGITLSGRPTSTTPNINFTVPNSVTTNKNGIAVLTALGSFQYLTISATTSGLGTNCALDVWYAGNMTAIPPQFLSLSLDQYASGLASNGSTVSEKSVRHAASASAAAGAIATTSAIASVSGIDTSILDCLTYSLQVQTTLIAPQYTTVTVVNPAGPTTLWQAYVGFPSGTLAGTSDSHTICGLALASPLIGSLAIGFTAGLTSTVESISVTYYTVVAN